MATITTHPAHSAECKHIEFDYEGRRYSLHESGMAIDDSDSGIVLRAKIYLALQDVTSAEQAREVLNGVSL
jgi:hypothetical protein